MTLDCGIFRYTIQPRVISVLSYYLTSLVNLSFCSFSSDDLIFPSSFRFTTCLRFFVVFLVSEIPQCSERDYGFWLVCPPGFCSISFSAAFTSFTFDERQISSLLLILRLHLLSSDFRLHLWCCLPLTFGR